MVGVTRCVFRVAYLVYGVRVFGHGSVRVFGHGTTPISPDAVDQHSGVQGIYAFVMCISYVSIMRPPRRDWEPMRVEVM